MYISLSNSFQSCINITLVSQNWILFELLFHVPCDFWNTADRLSILIFFLSILTSKSDNSMSEPRDFLHSWF